MRKLTPEEKEEYQRITEGAVQVEMDLEEMCSAPKIYGYALVNASGKKGGVNCHDAQVQALQEAGAAEIISDVDSGLAAERPELNRLLSHLRRGDTVMVTRLDRIANSLNHGLTLIDELRKKGIKLHILNMGVIDESPNGRMIRNIMLSFADFERSMAMRRTREGKAVAREKPGYREGRPKKYNQKQMDHAMNLLEEHSYTQVASMTGISKATLAREKTRRKGQS